MLYPVKHGDKWGYVSSIGEFMIKPIFDDVRCFSEGLASVKFAEKWGYIDENCEIVIRPLFDIACEFHNGYANVRINGRWSKVNKDGEIFHRLHDCTIVQLHNHRIAGCWLRLIKILLS